MFYKFIAKTFGKWLKKLLIGLALLMMLRQNDVKAGKGAC